MLLYKTTGDSMKEKFVIVDGIPDTYKRKFIGKGCSGECYLMDDGKVFKNLYNKRLDFDTIKEFTFVKNDSIIFLAFLISSDSLFSP